MNTFPEYKKRIENYIQEVSVLVDKYSSHQSKLNKEDASTIAINFKNLKEQCTQRLSTGLPKIMLYGIYNSGKSTLLNALMGEERAEVADIPKTYKVTSYTWNGYELLDTPGINAPIEHEIISKEALLQCQVILFVVSSAGSFENIAIFEAMKEVIEKDKHLFIVLNDKEGYGLDNPELRNIEKTIFSNLKKYAGLPEQKAASFRLCSVNAQLALLGRLDKDEDAINQSGIVLLEQFAFDEIKRVNGFSIVVDLCGYIVAELNKFTSLLINNTKNDSNDALDDFLEIRKEYNDFCSMIDAKIIEECALMPNSILNCFPSIDNAVSNQTISQDEIQNKIKSVYTDYWDLIAQTYQREAIAFKDRISYKIKKVLTVDSSFSSMSNDEIKDDASIRFADLLSQQPEHKDASHISAPENEIFDKIDDISNVISGTSIVSILTKLPILPIPTPIPQIVIKTILAVIPQIIRIIFGKSEEEQKKRRIEEEAEARRAAEEENARNMALWRQQLKQKSEDMTASFVRAARKNISNSLNSIFTPIMKSVEKELNFKSNEVKELASDADIINSIIANINSLKEELTYSR